MSTGHENPLFDPSDHEVFEVEEYLANVGLTETMRVVELERDGLNREAILNLHRDER